MKNFIAAVFLAWLLLIWAGVAFANDNQKRIHDHCSSISFFAEISMKLRVTNVSMAEAFRRADSLELTKSQLEVLKMIITTAYAAEHRSTPEGKAQMVADFRDMMFIECMQANGGF